MDEGQKAPSSTQTSQMSVVLLKATKKWPSLCCHPLADACQRTTMLQKNIMECSEYDPFHLCNELSGKF